MQNLKELHPFGLIGAVAAGVGILVWWAFFSRAPWPDRLTALGLMLVTLAAMRLMVHESIATGMMGFLLYIYGIPFLGAALVAWAAATRRLGDGPRRASLPIAVLAPCAVLMPVRTGGITGDGDSDFHWRWSRTPEERLLAQTAPAPAPLPLPPATAKTEEVPHRSKVGHEPRAVPAPPTAPEPGARWPGFRGPARDGIVRGARIATDWSRSPPVELWRRPIGPGWSSFAVGSNRLYTQEQRGENEVVACYNLTTGEPVWTHRDRVRFWESNAGAGPRGTPTLHKGRVYSLGATGVLNALDARTGAVIWSRNAGSDTKTAIPGWGFSSSPLVVEDLVIVAAAGALVAYDLATGTPRWFGPKGGGSYSSPHLAAIDGVAQVLLLSAAGVTSVSAADGGVLWQHALPPGTRIVQPAIMASGDILLAVGEFGAGNRIHRIEVARGHAGWRTRERWTSAGLKPNFNDFVVHGGHAYGFDGSILACIDLADCKRKWKGGRFGHGQLVLLPDHDLLLVLSEEGEVSLVRATPEQFAEVARFRALDGKTWNHPVLTGRILLVRNGLRSNFQERHMQSS